MPLLHRFICRTTNVVAAPAGAAGTDEVRPTASAVTTAHHSRRVRHQAPRREGPTTCNGDMLPPQDRRGPSVRHGASTGTPPRPGEAPDQSLHRSADAA